jgi:tRNA threonylcarbamoyladenosine biosynthesis protein TsaE
VRLKSRTAKTTQFIAATLAKKLLAKKTKKAIVIGLVGKLGSGKTTFIQGFGRSLKIKKPMTSPTFLIIRRYKLRRSGNYKNFYHIDAYRIKKPKEMISLDIKDIFENAKNIVVVEWANKIKKLLPQKTLWIKFTHGRRENERVITIKSECRCLINKEKVKTFSSPLSIS